MSPSRCARRRMPLRRWSWPCLNRRSVAAPHPQVQTLGRRSTTPSPEPVVGSPVTSKGLPGIDAPSGRARLSEGCFLARVTGHLRTTARANDGGPRSGVDAALDDAVAQQVHGLGLGEVDREVHRADVLHVPVVTEYAHQCLPRLFDIVHVVISAHDNSRDSLNHVLSPCPGVVPTAKRKTAISAPPRNRNTAKRRFAIGHPTCCVPRGTSMPRGTRLSEVSARLLRVTLDLGQHQVLRRPAPPPSVGWRRDTDTNLRECLRLRAPVGHREVVVRLAQWSLRVDPQVRAVLHGADLVGLDLNGRQLVDVRPASPEALRQATGAGVSGQSWLLLLMRNSGSKAVRALR